MKVSTKGRYALRAMAAMAKRGGEGSVRSIAEEEDISVKYLEAILTKLVKRGILKSRRGPSGGYEFPRPADAISAYEILDAMGDELVIVKCVGERAVKCGKTKHCVTRPLWENLNKLVADELKGTSLASLVATPVA